MANSLSHSKWMCKYHIVFIPKYRRKIIYQYHNKLREDIQKYIKEQENEDIIEDKLTKREKYNPFKGLLK